MADDITMLRVDVHYKGQFAPNPLVYYDPDRASIRDVDFSGMGYNEFIQFLEKLTQRRCKSVYYCLPEERLSDGLGIIQNEADYRDFIETSYGSPNKSVNVYIDDYNEPLFEWIEMEEPVEEDDLDDCEDDVDSIVGGEDQCEHEKDVDVVLKTKPVDDPFLNLLCPVKKNAVAQEDDHNEDEEVGTKEPAKYPVYDETMEWNKMVPLVGMRFANPGELKHLLSNYAVTHGYDLWYEKIDSGRLLVKCCKGKDPSCPFRLWATWYKKGKVFQIKTLVDTHNCSRKFKLGSIVTYKWVGKQFIQEIIDNPKISLRKMKAQISKNFNISVSLGQCRNAKRYALSEIDGNLREHYAMLYDYAEEVRRANPGFTVKMEVDIMPDSTTYFSCYYVCLKGVKDGWMQGCRKIICLDGCFLKGICKGELLSAVGRDANNNIYPLAWAVVNVENKNTWKWFIDLLMDDIEGGNGAGLTLMSDGHKGLLEAVKERVPEVEHRQCARHIYANLQAKYKGDQFEKPYWKAVKATTRQKFESAMEEIKGLDIGAHDYLMERDPKYWCRAFFQLGRDCAAMENGVSESFNAAILEARSKPIITMLEEIRVFVMQRLHEQRLKGEGWDLVICPSIRTKLKKLNDLQRFWTVYPSGFHEFEVHCGQDQYAVDLDKRICACRSWQLSGLPCVHAVAAIAYLNHQTENYVSPAYSKQSFMATYSHSIHPLNGSSMWQKMPYTPTLPPKRRRLPGRPKTNRRKSKVELESQGPRKHTVSRKGVPQKCSCCQGTGHNKASCPSNPLKKSKSKPPSATQASVPNESSAPAAATQTSGSTAPRTPSTAPIGPSTAPIGSTAPPSTATPSTATGKKGTAANAQTRKRKVSERILKQALKRRVVPKDGSGACESNPVSLD